MYKDEVRKKENEQLNRKFEEAKIPEFITRFFIRLNSTKSKRDYYTTIRDFLNDCIARKIIKKLNISDIEPGDMMEVEAEDIKQYLTDLEEKRGYSPTSVEVYKNRLQSFWGYLVDTNKCPVITNVVSKSGYKGISGNINIAVVPDVAELNLIEEKMSKKKDEMVRERNLSIFNLLKGTGIRETELANLDLDDVFLNGDDNEKRAFILILGKGKNRECEKRRVLLTGKSVKAIERWLEIRNKIPYINEESKNALYITRRGGRVTEGTIKDIFKTYGNGITPHMLRHWYASTMSKKFGAVFAQQQMGQSSVDTTKRWYIQGSYGIDLSEI